MKKLQLGKNPSFQLRQEWIDWDGEETKIAFASDFHFTGSSAAYAQKLAACILEMNPDLLILGGDYADTKAGLGIFSAMLNEWSGRFPITWIWGNHDSRFLKKLNLLFNTHDAICLSGRAQEIKLKEKRIWFDGHHSLLDPHPVFYSIRVLHQPKKPSLLSKWDLVLAGHLHGGQWVWFEKDGKMFPGAWIYPQNFLRREQEQMVYLVSKGLGDTLPIRWNCPYDILQINFKPGNL